MQRNLIDTNTVSTEDEVKTNWTRIQCGGDQVQDSGAVGRQAAGLTEGERREGGILFILTLISCHSLGVRV